MSIRIEGLRKTYPGGKVALDDVTFTIEPGMFGLLGPNGAGKTTLMRILTTLMEPTAGSATVNGFDIRENRSNIRAILGYLPQEYSQFPKLTTREFLGYSAELAGMDDTPKRKKSVDEMLEKVGLTEARDRQTRKLSGGMKRRLGIAQALIGDPKVIVVDEPTTGLDPEERLRFRDLLVDIAADGRTIILSTHIVGDITSSCQQMAVLDNGKLLYTGSPDTFVKNAQGCCWEITVPDNDLEVAKNKYTVVTTIHADDHWLLTVTGERPDSYYPVQVDPTLEHAYVHFLAGKTAVTVQ
jgi:ABC-2 type transport system ATP-binding protein